MPRELPIFPLPLVLFPGATQALHIFEPRYRQLLADCLEGDRRFGIAYARSETGSDPVPALGDAGCVAHIPAAHRLPDGRANIITVGERRFVLRRWLEGESPYRRALVDEFDDEPTDPAETAPLIRDVRADFEKLMRALGVLTDRDAAEAPLAADPAQFSFHVAAALELEAEQKQILLAIRSTSQRLRHLGAILRPLAADAERRARVHHRARGNGKGGERPQVEPLATGGGGQP